MVRYVTTVGNCFRCNGTGIIPKPFGRRGMVTDGDDKWVYLIETEPCFVCDGSGKSSNGDNK